MPPSRPPGPASRGAALPSSPTKCANWPKNQPARPAKSTPSPAALSQKSDAVQRSIQKRPRPPGFQPELPGGGGRSARRGQRRRSTRVGHGLDAIANATEEQRRVSGEVAANIESIASMAQENNERHRADGQARPDPGRPGRQSAGCRRPLQHLIKFFTALGLETASATPIVCMVYRPGTPSPCRIQTNNSIPFPLKKWPKPRWRRPMAPTTCPRARPCPASRNCSRPPNSRPRSTTTPGCAPRPRRENVRRRAQDDIAKAGKFAVEKFAGELLAVKDSLEAALASENQDAAALRAGVELTLKQLVAAFEKSSVSEINPLDEKFDPHRHQAISQVEADGEPNRRQRAAKGLRPARPHPAPGPGGGFESPRRRGATRRLKPGGNTPISKAG